MFNRLTTSSRPKTSSASNKGGPAVKFYESTGVDAATSTPEELAKFQTAESQKWGRIVKAANITPE